MISAVCAEVRTPGAPEGTGFSELLLSSNGAYQQFMGEALAVPFHREAN